MSFHISVFISSLRHWIFLFKWKSLQQGFALCPMLSVMDFLEPIVWASLLLQLSASEVDIYHHQLIVSDKVPDAC